MKLLIILLSMTSFSVHATIDNPDYKISYNSHFNEIIVSNNTDRELSLEIEGDSRSLMLKCNSISNVKICNVSKSLLKPNYKMIVHLVSDNGQQDATSHLISSLGH